MLFFTKYFRYLLLGFLLFFLVGERAIIASNNSDLERKYIGFQFKVVCGDRNLEKAIRAELELSDSELLTRERLATITELYDGSGSTSQLKGCSIAQQKNSSLE